MATMTVAARILILSQLRLTRLFAFLVVIWLPVTVAAQTEIHKCTDADGGIVYSQLPCPPPKPVEEETAADEAANDVAEQDAVVYEPVEQLAPEQEPRTEEEVVACKKRYRDAIDVIDAEIGREYTAEKGDEYKQRLLELTRKLRAC